MSPLAPELVALLLLAAVMHAGWNALVKSDADRLASLTAVMATGGLVGLAALPFVPPLAPAALPYLLVSVVLHTAYSFFLVRSYAAGDLSHVYPIARGLGPLLVAVFSASLVDERLGPRDAAGVLLVSGGILSLAFANGMPRGATLQPTVYALATGLAIASYTLVDGLGVRSTPNPLSYVAWLSFLEGPWMLGLALLRRGVSLGPALRRSALRGAVGGVVATAGYGIVLFALTRGAMANVAALRETSVLFASMIGTVWLGEAFGRRRAVAAALVAGGLLLMNLAGR